MLFKNSAFAGSGITEVNGLCDMEALIEQAFVFTFNFQFFLPFLRSTKLGIVCNNHITTHIERKNKAINLEKSSLKFELGSCVRNNNIHNYLIKKIFFIKSSLTYSPTSFS